MPGLNKSNVFPADKEAVLLHMMEDHFLKNQEAVHKYNEAVKHNFSEHREANYDALQDQA